MSRPIYFRPGISARVLLVVTPDAWADAARRSQHASPLRVGERPYTVKDAAAAFGALAGATAHRVIAEGDELLVEVGISEAELPEALRAEWLRLKALVETAVGAEASAAPQAQSQPQNGQKAIPEKREDEPTVGHSVEVR